MPKLPPEHIEKPRTVDDMAVGESGYVGDLSLRAYDDDTAYLSADAVVYDEPSQYRPYVERRADGFYVKLPTGLTYRLENHRHKWLNELREIVGWLDR